MPSKSEKQKKLMNAAAHNKEFADKVGIPQKVAIHFHDEDKKVQENNKTDYLKNSNSLKKN